MPDTETTDRPTYITVDPDTDRICIQLTGVRKFDGGESAVVELPPPPYSVGDYFAARKFAKRLTGSDPDDAEEVFALACKLAGLSDRDVERKLVFPDDLGRIVEGMQVALEKGAPPPKS